MPSKELWEIKHLRMVASSGEISISRNSVSTDVVFFLGTMLLYQYMKTYTQSFIIAFFVTLATLSLAPLASAQLVANPGVGAIAVSGLSTASFVDVLIAFMTWLFYLVGFLAVIAFIVAGLLYITSAGDTDQAERGKKGIIYAIIGIITALIGLIIINTVEGWMR